MSPTDELIPILKKLRMSGVLQSLEARTRQAVEDDLSHSEFLYNLLHDEVERRESKQLSLRLKRASFEHDKTIEDFDFAFNPNVPKAKILDLATCAFIGSARTSCSSARPASASRTSRRPSVTAPA